MVYTSIVQTFFVLHLIAGLAYNFYECDLQFCVKQAALVIRRGVMFLESSSNTKTADALNSCFCCKIYENPLIVEGKPADSKMLGIKMKPRISNPQIMRAGRLYFELLCSFDVSMSVPMAN